MLNTTGEELAQAGVEVLTNYEPLDVIKERQGWYDVVIISRPSTATLYINNVRKCILLYVPKAHISYGGAETLMSSARAVANGFCAERVGFVNSRAQVRRPVCLKRGW